MSEIYPFLPAAVEVFRVGSKTDMILRKDIKKQEQTDDEGKKYTVYACDERQQRVDGVLTADCPMYYTCRYYNAHVEICLSHPAFLFTITS